MAISNPRWPHSCRIYRIKGESSFSDGEIEILYEGKCRKYNNTSIRTFTGKDSVITTDYGLSLPGQVCGIIGALCDVTDFNGTLTRVTITDCYPTNLGTTAQFNAPKQ